MSGPNPEHWRSTKIALGFLGIIAAIAYVIKEGFSFEIYLLASSIFLLDGIDAAARLWLRRNSGALTLRLDNGQKIKPYAIILSIHNAEWELDRILSMLSPYKEQVWIVDDSSTDGTVARLRQAGWRHIKTQRNCKKPAALKYLLEQLPEEIATVLVLDPDTRLPANLEPCIASFQASGAAALAPRLTIRPDGLMAEFQNLEYTISFELGRKSLNPQSITSGIAMYERTALANTLTQHSLSVYAEDLENTVLLLADNRDVMYDSNLVIQTEGKRELAGWFSQRVGWAFGFLKVYVERLPEIRTIASRSPIAFYQYIIYFGLLSILAWPLKLGSLVLIFLSLANGLDMLVGTELIPDTSLTHPGIFVAVYMKYTCLTFIVLQLSARPEDRSRGLGRLPLYFFYCLLAILPTTVGYLNWVSMKLIGKRIYHDHYDEQPVIK